MKVVEEAVNVCVSFLEALQQSEPTTAPDARTPFPSSNRRPLILTHLFPTTFTMTVTTNLRKTSRLTSFDITQYKFNSYRSYLR